ncbi:MAG: trigger factor [Acidimicrobiia bacterium]|nr:trigger factor [Acidimicrobiia bacterium]
MKTTVEPLEGNKVRLSIEVDESEFEPALDAAFKRIAQEIRLPGFRPGKAPRKLLEARLGKGMAREEAIREAVPSYYTEAVVTNEVDVIAPPEIDITSGEDDGPVVFDAVVEVRPTVEVAGYQSLKVELPSPVVSSDEVDEQIDRMRGQYADLVTVDRPAADGDFVKLDIDGSRDGEPIEGLSVSAYSFEVGLGAVVPEIDENLRGASAGDHLEFSGDDHHHEPDELDDGHEPHGPIDFVVDVVEVQEKVLPELTDEWVAEASELTTVDELRDDMRERLTRSRAAQAQMALRDKTAGALAQLVTIDPPEPMVSAEMQQRIQDLAMRLQAQGLQLEQYLAMTGQPQEQFVEGLRDMAHEAVLIDLALRAVAAAEDLDATDDELDIELAEVAERVGETPEKVRSEFERSGQLPDVRSDLRKRKALEWLIERVEITDPEGNPIDRADLESPDEDDDVLGLDDLIGGLEDFDADETGLDDEADETDADDPDSEGATDQ